MMSGDKVRAGCRDLRPLPATSRRRRGQINDGACRRGRPTQTLTAAMTTLKTLLLVALVSAARADADTNSLDMDGVARMANEVWNNFTSFWTNEAPTSEYVLSTLHNLSDNVAARLGEVVRHLQTEMQAHSGQASETMQSASVSLNRTIKALQSPENRRRVEELRSSISSGLQTMAQEAGRVKDAVAEDTQGVRSQLHDVWSEAIKAAQRLGERVQAAVQEHQAEHAKE